MERNTTSGNQRGFTLIEVLVVVTLIVVLAGIGIATYTTSLTRAKEATLKEDLFRMNEAIDQYHADKGAWPQDIASLASAGYIRQIPKDPFTNSSETWQTEMSDPDPTNPGEMSGIQRIRSGAPGTALNGENYSDW